MDYSEFELSPIAFDYERMMTAHGYSLDEIVAIQRRAGVGSTPLLELRNLTDLVRSVSEPGKGARIFVKDEAANLAGAFKDRRASVSIHVAKEKGYEGVIAATSGNYGAAVASQAARNAPQVHHRPGDVRQPQGRPAGDRREGPRSASRTEPKSSS